MAQSKHVKADLVDHLFPKAPPFRMVQLGREAARKRIDDLKILQGLLLENEYMYPGIDRWYTDKVLPGLRTGERIAYLAFENEKPVASAVLKLGDHTKFCHVRIHEGFRDLDLGQMIFTQMAFQARHQKGVMDIHFTLPESLWDEKAEFFKSFGFTTAAKASRQYRNGEEELFCSAPLPMVWAQALKRLHLLQRFSPGGYTFSDKVLLSMRPSYAERVFARTKQVEIRKKFSRRWQGRQAVVYGTQPLGALMGEVTMSEISVGSPTEIWERYGARMGCTYEELTEYAGKATEVYAIELADVNPYISPVGIAQISHLINEDLRPPQSYLDVKMNEGGPWGKAISVVGLLHSWYVAKQPTL
jgi:predicted transcriptional regulator